MRRVMFKRSSDELAGEQGDVLAAITDDDVEAAALRSESLSVPVVRMLDAVQTAERDVIGAMLSDNRAYDLVVDILRAADFGDASCSLAFQAVADVVEGRNTDFLVADPVSVASVPGMPQLASLQQLQQWASGAPCDEKVLETRARMVRNAARERDLNRAVGKIQVIAGEDRSLESRSEDIQSVLAGASEVRELPLVSIGDAAVNALANLATRAQSGQTGILIPFGFRDLDALTGGLHAGQLIVIAARPGIGKTAFALSFALNAAAAGVHGLIASMEMKAGELSLRATSTISGVDSHALRMAALNEQEWELAVDAAERLRELPLDIIDVPSVDLAGLAGVARRQHRKKKLGFIVVDYLQIMKTSGNRGLSREQQIAELSRGLKELGMALGVPVVALSQLNRNIDTRVNKRPVLADLRESGAIEQDADVVIFIHREDAGSKSASDFSPADIIVEKQRAGSPGETQVCFIRRNTAFVDYQAIPNQPLLGAA